MDHAIDFAYLERQTFGDEALTREILALFVDQAILLLESIRVNDDRTVLTHAAHTLKGAARAIGATAVDRAAVRIESALSEDRRGDSFTLAFVGLEGAVAAACAAARLRLSVAAA